MPAGWYNRGIYDVVSNQCDPETSDLKCLLLKTTGAFDRDDAYVSDISANELTAVGYARVQLTNPVLNQDDIMDAVYLDGDDPIFGPIAAGQTIGYMVIFRDTGADATSPLLMCWKVVPTDTDGGEFTFEFSASGISKFWSAT
jgi:hypothetical protein